VRCIGVKRMEKRLSEETETKFQKDLLAGEAISLCTSSWQVERRA